MPSPDTVNFAIRPNKFVERKLIFAGLSALDPVFVFSKHRYVGFGAVWFSDFVLAHQALSIKDMVSLEKDRNLAKRAEFNRPFDCIKVLHGDSELILPSLDYSDKRILAWLDYDSSLNDTVLEDVSTLCDKVQNGSVLIVTVNGSREHLPTEDAQGEALDDWQDRCREHFRLIAPNIGLAGLGPRAESKSKYSQLLTEFLLRYVKRRLRITPRGLKALKLFDIRYRDGATMVTLGVALVNADLRDKILVQARNSAPLLMPEQPDQFVVDAPPLTYKEKAALDFLMPTNRSPTVETVKKQGFTLKSKQIKAYSRLHRYYPTFGEIVP